MTEVNTSRQLSRVNALRAVRAGAAGFRDGARLAECPYEPASPDIYDRFMAYYWAKGWRLADPGAPGD